MLTLMPRVFSLVMLMLCLCASEYTVSVMMVYEQHETNKWVRSSCVSDYAHAYATGVFTCYAYVMLMR